MKLREFVMAKALIPQLASTDRDGAIRELVDALIAAGTAPASVRDELVKLIIDREKKGSTGFGKGVAVPHAKHAKIKKMAAKSPVYSVVLLLSPADQPDEHLQAMECIFSNLQKDTFRRFLRQADTAKEIADLLEEADTQQLQA